jgi:hypothetical protein
MRERHVRYGKPREASTERRKRDEIVESDLSQHRATQHARQRAIPVELSIDIGRRVFDPNGANPPRQHLHERAFVSLMPRCRMTLKDAGCYGLPLAAHAGLLPATITNSPGIR